MRERPILFQGDMVRAILAGTKTQTRRLAKFKPLDPGLNLRFSGLSVERRGDAWLLSSRGAGGCWNDRTEPLRCPYGASGDRLWVREAFMHEPADYCWEASVSIPCRPASTVYRADVQGDSAGAGWKPSIHMPRALSRLTLEVTGVRVERLQEISEADAMAEGVERTVTGDGWRRYADEASELAGLAPCASACASYRALWEQINGAGSWEANPWVWVVEFRRLEAA